MSKSTQESPVDEVKALRLLYQIRYMLARPLQTKLLPFFVPVIPLPYLKHVPYITVGQLLLMFPWLLIFLAGYHSTFNSPDLTSGGTIASFAIVAAFLTANKASSVFTFFFGLSFERMVPIHNLYACLAVILSVFHGYVAYVHGDDDDSGDGGGSRDRRLSSDESQYALFGPDADLWKFLWDGDVNMTGSVCTACLVGLVLTSFFRIIRKYLFEPWLISHIVFSFGVIIFGVLHSVPLLILPFVWWMLDLVLRYGLHSCRRFPTNATLTKLSDDLVEVRFRRTFAFEAGQFVQINIPAVGATQFHPVTLSSAPFQKEAVLHIRALGGWSKALVKLAENTPEVNMLVEGPYGNLSVDVKDDQLYPVVLCISGGIGVTVSNR
jgi:dual oxidase